MTSTQASLNLEKLSRSLNDGDTIDVTRYVTLDSISHDESGKDIVHQCPVTKAELSHNGLSISGVIVEDDKVLYTEERFSFIHDTHFDPLPYGVDMKLTIYDSMHNKISEASTGTHFVGSAMPSEWGGSWSFSPQHKWQDGDAILEGNDIEVSLDNAKYQQLSHQMLHMHDMQISQLHTSEFDV